MTLFPPFIAIFFAPIAQNRQYCPRKCLAHILYNVRAYILYIGRAFEFAGTRAQTFALIADNLRAHF